MNRNRYTILLSNTVIFAVGNILVKLISFFLMPLYTSVLTTEQYGISELLNSAIEIVLPIGTLCIVDALYRFSIEKDTDYKAALANAIYIVLIGDIIILLGCIVLKYAFNYQYAFSFLVLYITTTFYKLTTQFARGLGHVKRYALYGVINSLVLVISNIILLVFLKGGVVAYLASFSIGYGSAGILAFFASKEYKYFSLAGYNRQLRKKMLYYSIPNIPNMLSWWINNLSDRYILMLFWGAGLTGLFTAASKLPAIINLVSSIFQQAWQYSTAVEIDNKDSNVFFYKVFRAYSFVCLTICTLLVLFNKAICKILLQSDFYSAWKFVPILLVAATLGCYSSFFGTYYNALKQNTALMLSTLIGAGVNIILNFVLIPQYGGLGAAIATVIGYAIITVIRMIDIKHRIKLIVNYKRLAIQFFLLCVVAITASTIESMISYIVGVICLIGILILDYDVVKCGIEMVNNILKKHF